MTPTSPKLCDNEKCRQPHTRRGLFCSDRCRNRAWDARSRKEKARSYSYDAVVKPQKTSTYKSEDGFRYRNMSAAGKATRERILAQRDPVTKKYGQPHERRNGVER